MFRMGRRMFVFMLTPAVSIIGSAIGIYLKLQQQHLEWWIVLSLAGSLVICAFVASYYTHIKPLRDPAANGRLLLDSIAVRIVKYGKDKNVPVRLNMLLIYHPARFLFCKKYLHLLYNKEINFSYNSYNFCLVSNVWYYFCRKNNISIHFTN